MKILIINKFLYPKGGDAVSAIDTGKLLSGKGHDVVYWGMAHPSNPSYPYSDKFVSYMDLDRVGNISCKIKTALKILYSLESKTKIEAIIRLEHPDIVHLHNFAHQISPSVLHVFKKYKIPVVMTMHDYKLVCPIYTMLLNGKPCEKCAHSRFYHCLINRCTKHSYTKSFLNTIEMYLHHCVMHIYDLIDVHISPSVFLKNKVTEMGFIGDIRYLPNFVNIEDYIPQYECRENSIIYFGRLSKEKGLSTLIKSMKDISAIKLKLIGDGPLRDELTAMVNELGLRNVEFLGHQSPEKLRNEIAGSMFVVLPSEWYENNPRSIIEAFAFGKCVVGARIGGIPELVKDGETGLLFESGNRSDLKRKLLYLISKPDDMIKMGKNARRLAENEFSSDRHYIRLMEIYKAAIDMHVNKRDAV